MQNIDKDGIVTSLPAGVILPFGGATAPKGFLLCDGANLLRANYADLFSAIGTAFGTADGTHFNVPDFRGQSLRGRDDGEGTDPDAATRTALKAGGATGDNVGSKQEDAMQGHDHGIDLATLTGADNLAAAAGNSGTMWSNRDYTNAIASKAGYGTIRVTSESRPKNVYVNYIIKD